MSDLLGVGLTVLLLALNALFVGAEFALISSRSTALEPQAAAGSRPARLALRAMGEISLVMAAAQLGITICTLLLGRVGEPAVAHLFEPLFELVRLPEGLVHPVAFVIATLLVVTAHVVLGEMVPKNLALVGPERASLVLGPFMVGVVWLLKPLVVALNLVANGALRVVRIEPKDEVNTTYTHDEVAGLIDESRREGLLDDDEYGLLSHALTFRAGTVEQVLLPLDRLVTVGATATYDDVERACATTGFSRFPVTGPADDLVGYVHVKDVLEEGAGDRAVADKRVRPLVTVGRTAGLEDALRTMQARGTHVARVAEPDGTVVGVVMLEDVLEELVGEVSDVRPSR